MDDREQEEVAVSLQLLLRGVDGVAGRALVVLRTIGRIADTGDVLPGDEVTALGCKTFVGLELWEVSSPATWPFRINDHVCIGIVFDIRVRLIVHLDTCLSGFQFGDGGVLQRLSAGRLFLIGR